MKFLHTSDWHLGAELEGHDRREEHAHFLRWLEQTLIAEQIEVLLMSGDIFHQGNPSASAQSMFYDFLRRLNAVPCLRRAVFVGGNHDSPSRLEAPKPLFDTERITMVGGYHREREDELLIPITDTHGDVSLVIVAVPYVHEVRLGVSAAGRDIETLRADTIAAFSDLYTRLGTAAKERWPGAEVVGMGHLTCGKASVDDYGTALHNVGTIESLPGSIFVDGLYRYVALGHIHRGYRVGDGPANYCGSPLTLRFTPSEMSTRQVVIVESTSGEYTRKPIPLCRTLTTIEGAYAAVERELRTLQHVSRLPTWVKIVLRTDERLLDPIGTFRAMAPENVEVIEVHQRRETPSEAADMREALPNVRELSPREVFGILYEMHHDGDTPSPGLIQKFDAAASDVVGGEHR